MIQSIIPFSESVRKSVGGRGSLGSSRKSLLGSVDARSKLTPKTPFFMRDHSYANKKRRESAAQKMSFCDSSLIADEMKSPQSDVGLLSSAVVGSLRKRTLNNEPRANRWLCKLFRSHCISCIIYYIIVFNVQLIACVNNLLFVLIDSFE